MKRFFLAALLTLLVWPPCLARSQVTSTVAVYTVKFVCGLQGPISKLPPLEPPVKPGNYASAINVLNFHTFPVTICKKAVLAQPEVCFEGGIQCPPVSGTRNLTLPPEQAMEVDCPDIVGLLYPTTAAAPAPSFIKGFVEIAVLSPPSPLGVTGVYTAEPQCLPIGAIHGGGGNDDPPLPQSCPVSIEVVPENSQQGEIPGGCVVPVSSNSEAKHPRR